MSDDRGRYVQPPYRRFIVFEIAQFYPSGGLRDINSSFDDIDEARKKARSLTSYLHKAEIVDRDTWETVDRFEEAE